MWIIKLESNQAEQKYAYTHARLIQHIKLNIEQFHTLSSC